MDSPSSDFSDRAGTFREVRTGDETYRTFLPKPLPPDPPIEIDGEIAGLLDQASRAVGRLDGVTFMLPDPDSFIYSYVRKEAILSSQIEGTQSSLSDLLLLEQGAVGAVPKADTQEASNYVAAMNHGLDRIAGGFPLSLRLIREVHEILLDGARGSHQSPGEFRRSQVWIGGTRPGTAVFVPPPADELMGALDSLERFIHAEPQPLPSLLKAAVAHAQFETIHPFLDGNGRIGRLMITLLLCADGVLSRPLLYLSLFLKKHRATYYERLQAVRQDGDWEGWIKFFLEAVVAVADEASRTTRDILVLIARDKERLLGLGKAAATALQVHSFVARHVYMTVPRASAVIDATEPSIYKAVDSMTEMGILSEVTGQKRNRVFAYDGYLKLLQRDDEELATVA